MDILLHLWDDFTANANPIGYLLLVAGAEFAGDVVRHPLVARIVRAYEAAQVRRGYVQGGHKDGA